MSASPSVLAVSPTGKREGPPLPLGPESTEVQAGAAFPMLWSRSPGVLLACLEGATELRASS